MTGDSAPYPVAPRANTYGPVTSVALVIAIFLGSQIIGSVLFVSLLLLLPGYAGLSGAAVEQRVMDNPWLYLPLMVLIEGLAVTGLYLYMRRADISWKDLGVGEFKPIYIAYAAAGYVGVMFANVIVTAAVGGLLPSVDLDQKQSLGITATAAGNQLIPLFIVLVILPPVVEELLMRGFLFTRLRQRLPFAVSAIIVSVLFGLAHITQADSGLFWSGAISFFVLSLMLCWLREKTNSLWPSIGVHMLQNGIAFTFLYLVKVV